MSKSTKNVMKRGVRQALYKYLPGSWIDFTISGGAESYSAYVERWNGSPISNINCKRLLRLVNQEVYLFRERSGVGMASTENFTPEINEDNYLVLQPMISEEERAVIATIKPLTFVCNKCGKVKQFYSLDEFKKHNSRRCSEYGCNGTMNQLKMIRYCKCGYADGIFAPRCATKDHGTKYMYRRGSGHEFYCRECGKKAPVIPVCSKCNKQLDIKPALDSAHFYPFTLSIIDLLDKRKDVFLDNEPNADGEKVVLAQYLGYINQKEYDDIIEKGKITSNDDFESELQKKVDNLRANGLPENMIPYLIEAERRSSGNNRICEAVSKVSNAIDSTLDVIRPLSEEILEFDELCNAKVVFTLKEAENDAKKLNDGDATDYCSIANKFGFSNVQVCSDVPIIFSAYGYTRKDREGGGVRLQGFPQLMDKKNIYATKLETEGVLFQFDRARILKWLLDNSKIKEMDLPQGNGEEDLKAWFLDKVDLSKINTFTEIDSTSSITKEVYTLIHSVSHSLIIEASEICGLDKSSLAEYIFPNIPAVFIYCQNAQGFNMGALYSAFQMHFDKWIKHACEKSKGCIFDPICIDGTKACAGCLFLNEVSCSHFNKDLNRSYICGHYDKATKTRIKGYWEE